MVVTHTPDTERTPAVRRSQAWVHVVAMVCALHLVWATSGVASAAKVFAEYTVRMEAWAKPTGPGNPIDVATMMLGDDVSDVLTIMVVRDANGLTPTSSDLAGFCTGLVGSYFPAQASAAEIAVALPSNLDDSLGYWGQEQWGSSFLICSLHDDEVNLFALLSTNTDVERTQALLTHVASAALTAEPPDAAARYLESVATRLGGDRLLSLTDLPGSEAVPAAFQFVDRDFQVGEQ